MNIFSILDRIIMHWKIAPGGGFAWTAQAGSEIIDLSTKKRLVHVKYYNSYYSALPVDVAVGRREEDGGLSFSPGLVIKFLGEEEEFVVTDEIPTKVLMEPEFSLEEIEQAQEVMDNLP